MDSKPFKGSNVFMSRNLVPPEVFDSLHDALKLNGATVFLCCDPSRNSPNDFHVIASSHHEKFEDLRAKKCNLLGPQCVLSCAKERRGLPRLGYCCCLAMDGVKVLASGFGQEEKERIGKLVTAMSGSFTSKTSLDVNFIIVKNVMAGKYKWAASKEKNIVTINWLNQCWVEHRVVPLEPYRVPPFSGLIICVTRIPGDERKEMEKLIIQNGGKYSAELTKLCTHLICEVPEGDKFKVAKRWGSVCIVVRKWFDQSIARRICLDEEAYSVQSPSISSASALRKKLISKSCQDKCTIKSQSILSSVATDSSLQAAPSVWTTDSDLDVAQSQNLSSGCQNVSFISKDEETERHDLPGDAKELDCCIADDSESDDGLYLSDCKICLVGFSASDVRKLVSIVRKGGGSRYMSCSERLTHIVVGEPSDAEKRDLRGLAAHGVIRVVKRNWLEDCDRERKEVPVIQKHIAYDLLHCKDSMTLSSKAPVPGVSSGKQGEGLSMLFSPPSAPSSGAVGSITDISLEKSGEDIFDINLNNSRSTERSQRTKTSPRSAKASASNDKDTSQIDKLHNGKSIHVFIGKRFGFSLSFPDDQRGEVVQWINQGGGEVVDDQTIIDVDFTIECHGVLDRPTNTLQTTYVSSHWIRSCLKDGRLLDADSHILFSPLPCRVPLPGFEGLRFCVSQYPEKERMLLRNLCFVLGAKFAEKLTRKVTHLLCKFANGPKYEAAGKWGVRPVRCEWLYECVRMNDIVSLDNFHPEEVPQHPEAGVCTVTQYPTQAATFISMDNSSQFSSQSQDLRKENTIHSSKRLRLSESKRISDQDDKTHINSAAVEIRSNAKENGQSVPDVAAAIEDLLEQTSKIQDLKSPVSRECETNIYSSDCSILVRDHSGSHSAFGPSRHWLSSLGKDLHDASRDLNTGNNDGFTETQDSQLVGYEEDLSGRQLLLDKARTISSSMT
ncbi:DNA topoisomerase 2-binding protein 1-A-like [Chenopodium quinoa]|uniref:DNA topoisomerase 2-binding protein 1-A-like n=1 Tax=Chenopodium quinoa TaxID=63459 RepID=UPI000B771A68|nr:DNA topoisomerase 2-binding protein 1-A-like [Chenopodium quinoa]